MTAFLVVTDRPYMIAINSISITNAIERCALQRFQEQLTNSVADESDKENYGLNKLDELSKNSISSVAYQSTFAVKNPQGP